jgi:hypothetical protein
MAAMAESEPVLPLPLEDAMGSEDALLSFLGRTKTRKHQRPIDRLPAREESRDATKTTRVLKKDGRGGGLKQEEEREEEEGEGLDGGE